MNVAWAMFWGGRRSTKPCVFPCKVAAAGDERYLVCAAGAAGVVSVANCSSYPIDQVRLLRAKYLIGYV